MTKSALETKIGLPAMMQVVSVAINIIFGTRSDDRIGTSEIHHLTIRRLHRAFLGNWIHVAGQTWGRLMGCRTIFAKGDHQRP